MPSQLLAEREEERAARGIAGQVCLTWSRERWVDDAKGQMGKRAKPGDGREKQPQPQPRLR
jgi:hypothetical protein